MGYGEKEELIINALGAFLEQCDREPQAVADSSKLPFPKEEIEAALRLAYFDGNASNEQRSLIKSVLITTLPYFQPGVGSKDVGSLASNLEGIDPKNLDPDESVAFFKSIVESSKKGEEWLAKANAESEAVMQELSAAERILDENKD